MDEISATVTILDRTYKLMIARSEEEYLRKAASLIDSQARRYGKLYAKDHQDLLAMVALTQITQLTKIQSGMKGKDAELENRLTNLNNLLQDALQNK